MASVMILSRNMLKRVGESRHPCRTPTVVRNQSPMLLLKKTALVALSSWFLMTRIRLVLMLYFFMVTHKAACQTLSKAFLKSMKTWWMSCWCWRYLSQRIRRLKSCSEVFHELVCPLTVVLAKIFFNLTTLLSYPVFFCLFMHLLMLLFTSLYFSDPSGSNRFFLSSLLSRRSRISAVTLFFLAFFFSFVDVCQGSHWLFQSLLC